MKKPVLVTGGNGFVGSHVVEALLAGGYSIRCLLRKHSQPEWIESLPVDIQRTDYFDPNQLRKVVSGAEAIFHFGGATKAKDEGAYHTANAETTGALLEAAADACPHLKLFLLCSSQAALGPSPSLDPLTEEAPPRPLTPYGRSKLEAEKLCRPYGDKFPVAVLRPPAIYGPRDKDILIFFRAIKWGISPSIGSGNRYLSMVSAMDVARISRLILEKKPQGFEIFHVTDGDIHDWEEVSRTIAEVMDRRPVRIRVPTGLALGISKALSRWASATGRVATLNREKLDEIMQSYWLMSSKKAQEALGYQPEYKLKPGMEATLKWYREKRWL